MTTAPPIVMTWDGEVFRPKHPAFVNRWYTAGERYSLAPYETRSARSHDHFFACIDEAFDNLPEDIAVDFASPEHLRKWALVKTGYRDERTFVASSKAEALRIAAFMRPADEFAMVVVRDNIVTVYTAQSQSRRAMGARKFQESKTAVLDEISRLIGVHGDDLREQAGKTA